MCMKTITLRNIEFNNNFPAQFILGPCALESREHALFMCGELQRITSSLGIPFVYKTSFDKMNRTSIHSPRGVGLEKAISIFKELKDKFNVPILTDVHEPWQCFTIKDIVDIIQIPAFLSRQTDLIIAAAQTGKVINIKKAQFMSPDDIIHVIEKIKFVGNGNDQILLTDRGTCFGYNTLVSDMRSLVTMANKTGYPVIFDATHSVQQPSANNGKSGGQREMVFPLARAAIGVGVAGIFMEVHNDPENAMSDGPNMIKLDDIENILKKLKQIDKVVKQ
jgi:2-dehydro-3-deoxyphosphooctonate aldolase (KDO 8-P synthase)